MSDYYLSCSFFTLNNCKRQTIFWQNDFSILNYFLGGVVMLFSERNYKHAVYKKVASILVDSAIVTWILLFILKLITEWTFLDYISIFVKFIFMMGLIIGSIPDLLEKDVKGIFWDFVIILIMIVIFFIL